MSIFKEIYKKRHLQRRIRRHFNDEDTEKSDRDISANDNTWEKEWSRISCGPENQWLQRGSQ